MGGASALAGSLCSHPDPRDAPLPALQHVGHPARDGVGAVQATGHVYLIGDRFAGRMVLLSPLLAVAAMRRELTAQLASISLPVAPIFSVPGPNLLTSPVGVVISVLSIA